MEETEDPNLLLVARSGLAVATTLITVTAVLPKSEAAVLYNKALVVFSHVFPGKIRVIENWP